MNLSSAAQNLQQRYDIPLLIPRGGTSIELGVAEGGLSQAILQSRRVLHHYAVDRYSGERSHDDAQYLRAVERLHPYRAFFTFLRADFTGAATLFPNAYFDFIYIDGYAHTGQDNGQTLRDWWPKLKPGGIFSGDDYSPDYPLTISVVDQFAAERNLNVIVTHFERGTDWASQQQSWLIQKPGTSFPLAPLRNLMRHALRQLLKQS
jgi:SAM-dependent methyltransferase